ncbi:MAG: hypothetical protein ACKVQJ_00390 [Pyrinomonadaceae bacterium]
MKYNLLVLLFTLFIFSAVASAQNTPAPAPSPAPTPAPVSAPTDISGRWSLAADAPGQTIQITVEFKQDGDALTGSTSSEMGNGTIDSGKVTGKTFTATLHADVQGTQMDFKMDGTVDGDKMTGTFTNPQLGTIPFSATKGK